MCDNWQMTWRRGFVAVGVNLLLGSGLLGCASQQQTAQALTIAGAAAVIVGASMAADEQCYDAAPGEGGGNGYCTHGYGKSTRNAGKGLAAAGVGLAAAGYAMTPKGPDRMRGPAVIPSEPVSPYRLIRRDPPPEEAASAESAGVRSESAPSAGISPDQAECRGDGASPSVVGSPSCGAAPAPPAATPASPPPPREPPPAASPSTPTPPANAAPVAPERSERLR
jgi:hypothetical protein